MSLDDKEKIVHDAMLEERGTVLVNKILHEEPEGGKNLQLPTSMSIHIVAIAVNRHGYNEILWYKNKWSRNKQ